jgi:hypothetical protein
MLSVVIVVGWCELLTGATGESSSVSLPIAAAATGADRTEIPADALEVEEDACVSERGG